MAIKPHPSIFVHPGVWLRHEIVEPYGLTVSKVAEHQAGRAALFHWRECDELEGLERGWLNLHIVKEGCLPLFNKAESPVRF
jgi:hypothetical protein